MEPMTFTIPDALKQAFRLTIKNYRRFFSLSTAIYGMLLLPNLFISSVAAQSGTGITLILVLYTIGVWSFFSASAYKISLKIIDGDMAPAPLFSSKGALRIAILNMMILTVAFLAFFILITLVIGENPETGFFLLLSGAFLLVTVAFYPQVWFSGMFIVDYGNSVFKSISHSWIASGKNRGMVVAYFVATITVFFFMSVPFLAPAFYSTYLVVSKAEHAESLITGLNFISVPLALIFMPLAYGFKPLAQGIAFREMTDEEVPEYELKEADGETAVRANEVAREENDGESTV